MRRLATSLATAAVAAATAVALASPAQAEPADKAQVLSNWTQTSADSYNTWLSARNDQGPWADYAFDWSTDYCSSSPDNPFGFPFQTACERHDFGYRNHKAMGIFDANKARIDSAFYEDLKRVCANYDGASKTACDSTAWTYYQAVKVLG
ncbi:phospholipase [Streptomyces cucumeris]|uniref:phospholipase n=1 Tax=Streptomyces cucumeris TaxID=2962890 RepID=UPI0020C889A2|nr:phospholipase [Streptomyces sp. NEAU-Y11]MCP9209909.1 phospholipase [Streptomyces sp. NEAU-Y11]